MTIIDERVSIYIDYVSLKNEGFHQNTVVYDNTASSIINGRYRYTNI